MGRARLFFRAPAAPSDAAAAIRDLASRLIPVYQDQDPERYLANLSALQLAVGDYASADISRQSLRERRRKSDFGHPVSRALVFDVYAHAKALEIENKVTFADAFTNSYRDTMRRLDGRDAFAATAGLVPPRSFFGTRCNRHSISTGPTTALTIRSHRADLEYVAFDGTGLSGLW